MLRFRPWLSVRHLADSPWARLMLVALVLVQVVAPSWHVCELGGRMASCSKPMAGMQGMAHGFPVEPGEGRQPIICVCRDEKPKTPPANEVRLDARADTDCHVQCLALLLQSMPGQEACAPDLFGFGLAYEPSRTAREHHFVPATQHRFGGRAPPVAA